jgi:mannose/fructose/N-acetylgalactosamine-specific phosphotransferase system component IIB
VELPLLRIDDRLVHGQVLVGWAGALRPARVLLGSDAIAADPVRRRIYAELAADDCEVAVATLAETAAALRQGGRLLAVCGSPAEARRLLELGCGLHAVNLGGLRGPDRRPLLPYVFLSRQDVDDLVAILALGVTVEARDLPGNRGVTLDAALLARLWE